MELIEQDAFPDFFKAGVGIGASGCQEGERGELLGVLEQLFVLADELLGFGLRRVAAAMIGQVELVVPHRRLQAAVGDGLFGVVEERAGGAELKLGKDHGGLREADALIHHLARRAAPMIAHAIQMHDLGKAGLRHVIGDVL